MKIFVALLFVAPLLVARCDGTGIAALAQEIADACYADPPCRAKYVASNAAELAADFALTLRSHGLATNATCWAIADALAGNNSTLVGLAMDLAVLCADPSEIANGRATAYAAALVVGLLSIALASFVAIFALIAAQSARRLPLLRLFA